MKKWLNDCKALVKYPTVWVLLHREWDWQEAYDSGLSPTEAVRFALLDVLAPTVGRCPEMGNYHALLSKSPAFHAEQAGYTRHKMPPSWVMDRLADEALTGKYDVSRSNICTSCFTARSVNGMCLCPL